MNTCVRLCETSWVDEESYVVQTPNHMFDNRQCVHPMFRLIGHMRSTLISAGIAFLIVVYVVCRYVRNV